MSPTSLEFQMAHSLAHSAVDLGDDRAVIAHLIRDHGVDAVTRCLDEAIEGARALRANVALPEGAEPHAINPEG